EIAEKLGVRHILEGSLRREGNRIRVTAQLVNANDGFHLWSETYERELQGVFALQDEITRAITDALKVKLAGARPTPKQHTEAHIWMGESKRILDWDLEGFKAELNRALQLDPNSATAHIFMGLYEATQGNKDAAAMHVRESTRLDPLSPIVSHFAAVAYLCLGLLDEAI